MKQKKIVFLTRPISPPWDEGTKNFTYTLASHLKPAKAKVYLLTADPKKLSLPRHIGHIVVPAKNQLDSIAKLPLLKFLISTKADIIHCQFVTTFFTSLIIKIIKFFKKFEVIQTIIALETQNPLLLKLAKYSDQTICFSQNTASILTKAGFKNLEVIPPGVDLTFFKPQRKRRIIALLGELYRFKNFKLVERLIPKILKKFPDYQLIVAFRLEGKFKKEEVFMLNKLKKRFGRKKRVSFEFAGLIENMPQFLGPLKLVLFPTTNTRGKFDLPLVLIESLACGTPAVISPLAPLKELANHKGAYAPAKNNPDAFIKTIREVLSANFNQKSKEARRTAEEFFDIRKIARQYEAIYENL